MSDIPLRTRPAIVDSFDPDSNTVTYRFADFSDGIRHTSIAPHPFVSNGWGIFAGPTPNTCMLMTHSGSSGHIPVATKPHSAYSPLSGSITNMQVTERKYPRLEPGDLVLQGLAGSKITLTKSGIQLKNTGDTYITYDANLGISNEYFKHKYINTEAYRSISGTIKRDLRSRPRESELNADKLFSLDYEQELTIIGRNPELRNLTLTSRTSRSSEEAAIRNPALAEHRLHVYEYALSEMTGTLAEERDRLPPETDPSFLNQPSRRDLRRTDVLNMGPQVPNMLYEQIIGTTVDIYGNILDLNRNKILFAAKGDDKKGEANEKNSSQNLGALDLETNLKLLRRSVKYHLELNSKKKDTSFKAAQLDAGDGLDAIGYSHSRFTIDVDGEGLTKINIPSSSNTGNIPLLSRYINTYDKPNNDDSQNANNVSYVDETQTDIQHFGFGSGEGNDLGPDYAPPDILTENTTVKYRTAYHDIIATAKDTGVTEPISDTLGKSITDAQKANAGGRSLHANLDGSAELNIGRDVVDNKSLVLDTAGSAVVRVGKDKNDNSLVTELDGNIYVQVGGSAVGEDEIVDNPQFTIKIKSGDDTNTISIGEEGITIFSGKNTPMHIKAGSDLTLEAAGTVRLKGNTVDINEQRVINPTGREI